MINISHLIIIFQHKMFVNGIPKGYMYPLLKGYFFNYYFLFCRGQKNQSIQV